MEILEQSLVPKSPQKKSEDGIVVTDDFVAVIDGSTSKSQFRFSQNAPLRALIDGAAGASNGRYAMLLVSSYIRHMDKATTCDQFLRGVTTYIRKRYQPAMLPRLAEHPEDRLTCSVVVFSRLCRELWMVGDCQALAFAEASHYQLFENPKPAEAELAAQRATEVRRLLAEGHRVDDLCRNDLARPTIIPRMLETMRQQNIGYSVVDGFAIPRRHVRIIPFDFQPWQIVLATDGYPFLRPTLAESEQLLRRQHEQDPLNIGPAFQATKAFHPDNDSFDDRAYIRISI